MGDNRYEIKISGKGDIPGLLSKLASDRAKVLQLSYVDGVARFRTDRHGVGKLRKYRRRYRVKVQISPAGNDKRASGIISSYHFLIVCLIPFVASLFLWSVEVESTMPEVSERIEVKLKKAAIVPFKPLSFIPDEGEIRQLLMLDDPALSWVRFKREGSTLTVIPMLSPPSNEETAKKGPPSHLVAKTGGVITRFELKSGERVGRIHQTVKKGELLATGVLEQGNKTVVVGADGSVFADYWVEYSFSMPKQIVYQFQGEEVVDFIFHPPWKKEAKSSEFNGEIQNWPFISTHRYTEKVAGQLELTEGMEESVLIPLLRNKLLSESLSKAVILDEKILHVTFDNDKVKGTILFQINDNIAVKKPIPQGD